MINVTKTGSPDLLDPTYETSCSHCGCEFTYQSSDVKYDRDGHYVICPTKGCGHFIGHGNASVYSLSPVYRPIYEDH